MGPQESTLKPWSKWALDVFSDGTKFPGSTSAVIAREGEVASGSAGRREPEAPSPESSLSSLAPIWTSVLY